MPMYKLLLDAMFSLIQRISHSVSRPFSLELTAMKIPCPCPISGFSINCEIWRENFTILDVRSEPGLCANNNICLCAVQVIQFLSFVKYRLAVNIQQSKRFLFTFCCSAT